MNADTVATPSLADELRPQYGVKAEALAQAYERYCQHDNRERFEGEVRAIKGSHMAGHAFAPVEPWRLSPGCDVVGIDRRTIFQGAE